MKNPTEIQEFLRGLFFDGETIKSNAKAEAGEADSEIQLNLKRTIENGLSKIEVVRSPALNNTLVTPVEGVTTEFDSPQAYVDAVTAFVAEPANQINIVDGIFINSAIP
jgi:hypothetical protein